MGSLDRHLAPDEGVLFQTRLHPMVFSGAASFAAFVFGVVMLVILRNDLPPGTVRTMLWVGAATAGMAFVAPALRWWHSGFAVTSRRVLVTGGLLWTTAIEVPHGDGAVEVDQTLGGRLLGYGTLYLGRMPFPRVARAVTLCDEARRLAPAAARARGRER